MYQPIKDAFVRLFTVIPITPLDHLVQFWPYRHAQVNGYFLAIPRSSFVAAVIEHACAFVVDKYVDNHCVYGIPLECEGRFGISNDITEHHQMLYIQCADDRLLFSFEIKEGIW